MSWSNSTISEGLRYFLPREDARKLERFFPENFDRFTAAVAMRKIEIFLKANQILSEPAYKLVGDINMFRNPQKIIGEYHHSKTVPYKDRKGNLYVNKVDVFGIAHEKIWQFFENHTILYEEIYRMISRKIENHFELIPFNDLPEIIDISLKNHKEHAIVPTDLTSNFETYLDYFSKFFNEMQMDWGNIKAFLEYTNRTSPISGNPKKYIEIYSLTLFYVTFFESFKKQHSDLFSQNSESTVIRCFDSENQQFFMIDEAFRAIKIAREKRQLEYPVELEDILNNIDGEVQNGIIGTLSTEEFDRFSDLFEVFEDIEIIDCSIDRTSLYFAVPSISMRNSRCFLATDGFNYLWKEISFGLKLFQRINSESLPTVFEWFKNLGGIFQKREDLYFIEKSELDKIIQKMYEDLEPLCFDYIMQCTFSNDFMMKQIEKIEIKKEITEFCEKTKTDLRLLKYLKTKLKRNEPQESMDDKDIRDVHDILFKNRFFKEDGMEMYRDFIHSQKQCHTIPYYQCACQRDFHYNRPEVRRPANRTYQIDVVRSTIPPNVRFDLEMDYCEITQSNEHIFTNARSLRCCLESVVRNGGALFAPILRDIACSVNSHESGFRQIFHVSKEHYENMNVFVLEQFGEMSEIISEEMANQETEWDDFWIKMTDKLPLIDVTKLENYKNFLDEENYEEMYVEVATFVELLPVWFKHHDTIQEFYEIVEPDQMILPVSQTAFSTRKAIRNDLAIDSIEIILQYHNYLNHQNYEILMEHVQNWFWKTECITIHNLTRLFDAIQCLPIDRFYFLVKKDIRNRGRLCKPDGPLSNHKVVLLEDDYYDLIDFLNSTSTDENGKFNIFGTEAEFFGMQPVLCFKHNCTSDLKESIESWYIQKKHLDTVLDVSKNFGIGYVKPDLRINERFEPICNRMSWSNSTISEGLQYFLTREDAQKIAEFFPSNNERFDASECWQRIRSFLEENEELRSFAYAHEFVADINLLRNSENPQKIIQEYHNFKVQPYKDRKGKKYISKQDVFSIAHGKIWQFFEVQQRILCEEIFKMIWKSIKNHFKGYFELIPFEEISETIDRCLRDHDENTIIPNDLTSSFQTYSNYLSKFFEEFQLDWSNIKIFLENEEQNFPITENAQRYIEIYSKLLFYVTFFEKFKREHQEYFETSKNSSTTQNRVVRCFHYENEQFFMIDEVVGAIKTSKTTKHLTAALELRQRTGIDEYIRDGIISTITSHYFYHHSQKYGLSDEIEIIDCYLETTSNSQKLGVPNISARNSICFLAMDAFNYLWKEISFGLKIFQRIEKSKLPVVFKWFKKLENIFQTRLDLYFIEKSKIDQIIEKMYEDLEPLCTEPIMNLTFGESEDQETDDSLVDWETVEDRERRREEKLLEEVEEFCEKTGANLVFLKFLKNKFKHNEPQQTMDQRDIRDIFDILFKNRFLKEEGMKIYRDFIHGQKKCDSIPYFECFCSSFHDVLDPELEIPEDDTFHVDVVEFNHPEDVNFEVETDYFEITKSQEYIFTNVSSFRFFCSSLPNETAQIGRILRDIASSIMGNAVHFRQIFHISQQDHEEFKEKGVEQFKKMSEMVSKNIENIEWDEFWTIILDKMPYIDVRRISNYRGILRNDRKMYTQIATFVELVPHWLKNYNNIQEFYKTVVPDRIILPVSQTSDSPWRNIRNDLAIDSIEILLEHSNAYNHKNLDILMWFSEGWFVMTDFIGIHDFESIVDSFECLPMDRFYLLGKKDRRNKDRHVYPDGYLDELYDE
ncbi:unnamed protein product [Caenorhabditis angaria]|uniref:DUF7809 domain-containing protein n=1 Tax=Caenorhabditis angaria TaxID=860376 RepID=A0A9P1N380_9PELO|nr:unnamed protein product [Caenorhabditis angaria]